MNYKREVGQTVKHLDTCDYVLALLLCVAVAGGGGFIIGRWSDSSYVDGLKHGWADAEQLYKDDYHKGFSDAVRAAMPGDFINKVQYRQFVIWDGNADTANYFNSK